MARKIDIARLKASSLQSIEDILERIESAEPKGLGHLTLRWMSAMSSVELLAVWERYAENRLVAAVNHSPAHFLTEQNILGITSVPSGLAFYVVRSGNRFFDFRSMSELIQKANRLTGKKHNPFDAIDNPLRQYLDALAAIRNCVVHGSAAARSSYRRQLKEVYGVRAAPEPDEFLRALDRRAASPARNKPRLNGLAAVVTKAIENTSL